VYVKQGELLWDILKLNSIGIAFPGIIKHSCEIVRENKAGVPMARASYFGIGHKMSGPNSDAD